MARALNFGSKLVSAGEGSFKFSTNKIAAGIRHQPHTLDNPSLQELRIIYKCDKVCNLQGKSKMDLIVDFPSPSPPSPEELNETAQQEQEDREPTPPRRAVRFTHSETRHIDNLAVKYKHTLWYNDADIQSFKYQTAWLLRTIRANNMTMIQYAELNASQTAAFMGLENYLSDVTTKEIKIQRRAVREAVMYEQERQRELGLHVWDMDTMANISEVASAWGRERAEIVAALHVDRRPQDQDDEDDVASLALSMQKSL